MALSILLEIAMGIGEQTCVEARLRVPEYQGGQSRPERISWPCFDSVKTPATEGAPEWRIQ